MGLYIGSCHAYKPVTVQYAQLQQAAVQLQYCDSKLKCTASCSTQQTAAHSYHPRCSKLQHTHPTPAAVSCSTQQAAAHSNL